MRRLRRILPEGTHILVAFFADEEDEEFVKALRETAEADAYATSLAEAVEHCVKAAKGELNGKKDEPNDEVKAEAKSEASAPPKTREAAQESPRPGGLIAERTASSFPRKREIQYPRAQVIFTRPITGLPGQAGQ